MTITYSNGGATAEISGTGQSVINDLRTALANVQVTTIVLPAGDYHVVDSSQESSDVGIFVGHDVSITSQGSGANFYDDAGLTKALFNVTTGVNASFTNIGFYETRDGASDTDSVSGLRHMGNDLYVFNCRFENNTYAIQGGNYAPGLGNVYISGSHFYNNGSGSSGELHQIYYEGNSFVIMNSEIIDTLNVNAGHAIKSVSASYTTITGNTIDNGLNSGAAISVAGGGNLTIDYNNITTRTSSGNVHIIEYATARHSGADGIIDISNNIVNAYGLSGRVLLRNYSDSIATLTANELHSYSGASFNLVDLVRGMSTGSGLTIDGLSATSNYNLDGTNPLTALNDYYAPTARSETIRSGGAGDDILIAVQSDGLTDALFGGDGNDQIAGGSGNDLLYGGSGNDVIFVQGNGNSTADFAAGGEGDDIILMGPGNAGSAYMNGGAGNDMLDGRGLTSTLSTTLYVGDSGNDTILAGITGETISGGVGNDRIFSGNGNDEIWGGAGTDILYYESNFTSYQIVRQSYEGYKWEINRAGSSETSGWELVFETEVIQFSDGYILLSEITANAAGDFVATTANFHSGTYSNAGLGINAVTLTSLLSFTAPAFPTGTPGQNLTGTAAAESLTGGTGNDTITGLGGADTLNGGDGNDLFRVTGVSAADGYDVFIGGAGTDTIAATAANVYIGIGSLSGIEVLSSGGFANVLAGGAAAADVFDFTNITITGIVSIGGGGGNDLITGNAADNVLRGDTENDTVLGAGGNDTLQGNDGNDSVNGGDGDDSLFGNAGSDTIVGGAGTDTANYGLTRATYVVTDNGNGTYAVVGDGATDTLSAIEYVTFSDGTFTIASLVAPAGQTITGTSAAQSLAGGAGNDTITGLGGNDTISGGAGNDSIRQSGTGAGYDVIDGGTGTDTLLATTANTALGITSITGVEVISAGGLAGVYVRGGSLADTLNFSNVTLTGITYIDGGSGNDTITGSAAADTIKGGGGVDSLIGGAGGDRLQGGIGQDVLTGGLNSDGFVWDDGEFGGMTATTADRITDFSKADFEVIDLSLVDAKTATATTDDAFTFIGTAAFSNVAGQLRYQQTSGNTYVMGDQDGNGTADFWIRIDGLQTMVATDFVL